MAVKHGVVDLSTTPVNMTAEADTPVFAGNTRFLRVQNTGSAEVFIGGPNVSSTDYGMSLASGASVSFDLASDEAIYAVVAPVASPGVAAGTVRLLHTGL